MRSPLLSNTVDSPAPVSAPVAAIRTALICSSVHSEVVPITCPSFRISVRSSSGMARLHTLIREAASPDSTTCALLGAGSVCSCVIGCSRFTRLPYAELYGLSARPTNRRQESTSIARALADLVLLHAIFSGCGDRLNRADRVQ